MGHGVWVAWRGGGCWGDDGRRAVRASGWLDADQVARIERIHQRRVCRCGPGSGCERYLELMAHDKKVEDGKFALVLLKDIGGSHSRRRRSRTSRAIAARLGG